MADMARARDNTHYLKGYPFPPALQVTADFDAAVAHAGLVHGDLVGTRTDACVGPVLAAVRLHDNVVVGEQVGQVGVRLLQRQHDVLAVDLDGLDALHVAERARLRLLVRMALQRCRDVFGGDGLPLGIMEDPLLDAPRRLQLNPGDMLLLVTDGFTEAAHPQTGEMYGIDRLRSFIQSHRDTPGPQLLQQLADDVGRFTLGTPQADDMTAVLIHRLRTK